MREIGRTLLALVVLLQVVLIAAKQGALFDRNFHTPVEQWSWAQVWAPTIALGAVFMGAVIMVLLGFGLVMMVHGPQDDTA